jgi:hypothetical protein
MLRSAVASVRTSSVGGIDLGTPTTHSKAAISERLCPSNSWTRLRGAYDVCFYYPRFAVETHLPDTLPELTAAKRAIYEAEAAGDSVDTLRIKVRALLARAGDVFTTACGGDLLSDSGAAPAVRSAAVAVAASVAATQKPTASRYSDFRLCVALTPAVRAVAKDTAMLSATPEAFDAGCFCVASYARAMTNQLMRGEWGRSPVLAAALGMDVAATTGPNALATPREAMNAVEALQVACLAHARSGGPDLAFSFRSTYNKLAALAALLQVEHNNDSASALDLLEPLRRFKGANEIEKHLVETLACELRLRAYGHAWGRDAVDSEVESQYHLLQDWFTQHFTPWKPEGAVEMPPGDRVLLRDAYSMMQLSMAGMYQELPRMDAADQTFPLGARLYPSPFVHVPCASQDPSVVVNLKSAGTCIPCATQRAQKLATAYADRAMRINRKIFPDSRNNARAASALRALAINFTDVRDYLYASGMFNSAERTFEALYGRASEEMIELLMLQHRMQTVLKNDREAEATWNKLQEVQAEFETLSRRSD